MNERFIREEMLLGEVAMERLASAHVAVLGLGGVGSFAAEALARGGIGRITLVDHDVYGMTNINRQLGALTSTLDRSKVCVMAERVLDINPDIQVTPLEIMYSAESREVFFEHSYDYIVDAIDQVSGKLDLIASAIERDIPIISAMGTGNKLDATKLEITDISKTKNCPLARVVRKELRKRGIYHHTVLFSSEDPVKPDSIMEEPPPGRRSIPGSVSWVPPCAGLMLAGEVILKIAGIS